MMGRSNWKDSFQRVLMDDTSLLTQLALHMTSDQYLSSPSNTACVYMCVTMHDHDCVSVST